MKYINVCFQLQIVILFLILFGPAEKLCRLTRKQKNSSTYYLFMDASNPLLFFSAAVERENVIPQRSYRYGRNWKQRIGRYTKWIYSNWVSSPPGQKSFTPPKVARLISTAALLQPFHLPYKHHRTTAQVTLNIRFDDLWTENVSYSLCTITV